MECLIILAVVFVAAVCGQSCDCKTGLIKYYKELNCQPVFESGACCPSRFDCYSLANWKLDTCYVNGRTYAIGSQLTQVETGRKCVEECNCLGTSGVAQLKCEEKECSAGDRGATLAPNCHYTYSPDKCCSSGVACKNETELFTCQYEGETYKIGEIFYPKEKPCFECYCQEGYDGTLNGPWCHELSCSLDIYHGPHLRNKCAPKFVGYNSCCPIGWRCPSMTDFVPAVFNPRIPTASEGECVFGQLRLNVGDTLNSDKLYVDCTCVMPPHVTCVLKEF